MLFYNSNDGTAAFGPVNAHDEMPPEWPPRWQRNFGKGWTSVVPVVQNDRRYVQLYDALTGNSAVWQVVDNEDGCEQVWPPDGQKDNWGAGWSSVAPFEVNGEGGKRQWLFLYNKTDGSCMFRSYSSDGPATQAGQRPTQRPGPGFTSISVTLPNTLPVPVILAYNTETADVRLYEIVIKTDAQDLSPLPAEPAKPFEKGYTSQLLYPYGGEDVPAALSYASANGKARRDDVTASGFGATYTLKQGPGFTSLVTYYYIQVARIMFYDMDSGRTVAYLAAYHHEPGGDTPTR
ncbi:hypothetical protein [Micromonospora sp. ATCC 39149]|uniref:Fucose-specific lectin n=1 Tax=Micromonospora carbonacea TaxID=47853 RepID=A0A7D5YJD4_9ACTN|nr:hypothetical protein [Micromonospora sp. ATCC 39149]QLJ99294.1 hypothetical protein HZU44_03820 [Micromonospora carbonacea]